MTNSKLTERQLERIIECADEVLSALAGTNEDVHRDNSTKMCRLWDDLNDTHAPPEVVLAMARELQEYRKAATASFYRDGIEAAAKWVDQLRESYDNEYGYHDPDTGTFEFGNDAQREYSDTLVDVAGGIRALHPNACRAAMQQPVSNRDELPEETGSLLQLRNLIRQRHAEWSQATFGDVGPVGPLKHLSKEALEAAAEPGDLSEWADMQFLLWDAQRRAGLSDGEITAAMEEKLKVNMARHWPEPKEGEPRLHIKEAGNSPVIPDGWIMVPKEPTPEMREAFHIANEESESGRHGVWSPYHQWQAMLAAAPQQEEI